MEEFLWLVCALEQLLLISINGGWQSTKIHQGIYLIPPRHYLQIFRPETDLGDFTFPVDTANICFILKIRETTHPKSHTH